LVSDRWGGYNFFCGIRQICWTHLKRDFKAISAVGGSIGKIEASRKSPDSRSKAGKYEA
jgi:hypothetical protein